jgi:peptidoglycan/xylan/chitin deacetylase (PgdA/CDA1 family)
MRDGGCSQPAVPARSASAGRQSPWQRRVATRSTFALLGIVLVGAGIALPVALAAGSSSAPASTNGATPPPRRDHERRPRRQASWRRTLERRAHAAAARFARLGLPVYCGGHHGRFIALTFDDGPGPATERVVLPLLRRAGARATFFVIGQNIPGHARALRGERALGAVGNHTWSHARLTALGDRAVSSELGETQRQIERATGRRPNVFRPPYGARNARVDAAARSLGLVEVLWSIDSYDSRGFSAREVAHTVLKLVQPGAIILMHENLPATVKALPRILRILNHRRFELVTVPELLALDPPSPAQLRQGLEGCYARATRKRNAHGRPRHGRRQAGAGIDGASIHVGARGEGERASLELRTP